jgi:hypothetical protein
MSEETMAKRLVRANVLLVLCLIYSDTDEFRPFEYGGWRLAGRRRGHCDLVSRAAQSGDG